MSGDVWQIEPGDWPPTRPGALPAEQVRQVLDDAFDRHYEQAVKSLADVEIPRGEP